MQWSYLNLSILWKDVERCLKIILEDTMGPRAFSFSFTWLQGLMMWRNFLKIWLQIWNIHILLSQRWDGGRIFFEERENPDQIIIGSMDPNYSVILALSLHLEQSTLEMSQQDGTPLLFSILKRRKRALFEEITTLPDSPLS